MGSDFTGIKLGNAFGLHRSDQGLGYCGMYRDFGSRRLLAFQEVLNERSQS